MPHEANTNTGEYADPWIQLGTEARAQQAAYIPRHGGEHFTEDAQHGSEERLVAARHAVGDAYSDLDSDLDRTTVVIPEPLPQVGASDAERSSSDQIEPWEANDPLRLLSGREREQYLKKQRKVWRVEARRRRAENRAAAKSRSILQRAQEKIDSIRTSATDSSPRSQEKAEANIVLIQHTADGQAAHVRSVAAAKDKDYQKRIAKIEGRHQRQQQRQDGQQVQKRAPVIPLANVGATGISAAFRDYIDAGEQQPLTYTEQRQRDRVAQQAIEQTSNEFREMIKELAELSPPDITIWRLTNDKTALARSKWTASLSEIMGWKNTSDSSKFTLAEELKGWVIADESQPFDSSPEQQYIVVGEDGRSWSMGRALPGKDGRTFIAIPSGKKQNARVSNDLVYAAAERAMNSVEQDVSQYDSELYSDSVMRRLMEWYYQKRQQAST